jgi:hypothetical protein
MSNNGIILVGATGELGGLIASELSALGGNVRALVRKDSATGKADRLRSLGLEVMPVDFNDHRALIRACEGGDVVLSAVAGLRDVIVDLQSKLLEAAVQAGVRRFIPSDFAIDFTRIPEGWNRNLNLRSEFKKKVDASGLQVTSILNGAFTDMLTGMAPFVLFKFRRILCWGNPDQLMDWTTMADTARFTAAAALDPSTPRFLRIAGDQISARGLASVMTEVTGEKHKILRPGGLGILRLLIGVTKLTTRESGDLYPPWQGMQYMHNMYAGIAKFKSLDNDRYPMRWTTARDVLSRFVQSQR